MLYDSVAVIAVLMLAAAAALPFTPGTQIAGRDPVYTLYLASFWFIYLAWCWRNGGMTLGMRAWRVRLVSEEGGPPGWGECAIRFGTSLVSAAAAGMGFLWAVFDRHARTWHDRASRTRLIHEPKPKRSQTVRRST